MKQSDDPLQQILRAIKGLENGQRSLEGGQQSLEEGQKSLVARQTSLEEGQKSLVARQTSLEEGQQLLMAGQKRLEKNYRQLEGGQKQLQQSFTLQQKEIAGMRTELRDVHTEVRQQGVRQEAMEGKLSLIVEAISPDLEKHTKLTGRVDDHDHTLAVHDLRLRKLEQ